MKQQASPADYNPTRKETEQWLAGSDTCSIERRLGEAYLRALDEIEELQKLVLANERLTEYASDILGLVAKGAKLPSTAEFDKEIVRIVNDGIKTGHVTTLLDEVKP